LRLWHAQLSKVYEHGGKATSAEKLPTKQKPIPIEDDFEFVMDKGGAGLFRKLK